MPAYSSHILQPLDVSCFAVLKRFYGRAVEEQMRVGINHVDKDDFLKHYLRIRSSVYTSGTIQNGFKAAGLVPFDPDEVISKLDIRIRTPSLTLNSTDIPSPWKPETPHNVIELQSQTEAIHTLIRYTTQSPPSPAVQAVNQLVKCCQLAIYSAAILAAENKALRAANEKIQKKRQKKRSFVDRGGVLIVGEVQEAQRRVIIDRESENQGIEQFKPKVLNRAPSACSICRLLQHTARTCPERQ
jgi:hypothetical protein